MTRLLAIATLLAVGGCGAANSYVSTPSTTTQETPDSIAKKVDLLYISDGNGEVTVYTYWQKTLVRELTGFTQPEGECVDNAGDVFITDYGAKQIVEYAHDGTKPLATIDDAPYTPYGCSVDLSTGNLAVANEAGSASQGNIAIYAFARGTPKLYTDKNIPDFQGCAYDSHGNLLATNGQAGSRYSTFAYLPKGGVRLVDVTLPGSRQSSEWEGVDGIQWDGKYWVLDEYGELFRESIVNGQGFYIGDTYFSCCDVDGPFWIYNIHPNKQGTQVVGVAGNFSYTYVDFWNYPGGGDSIGGVSHGLDKPTAVAVSLGKIHE